MVDLLAVVRVALLVGMWVAWMAETKVAMWAAMMAGRRVDVMAV